MGRNSGGVVNINQGNGNSAKVQVALNGSRPLSTIKDKSTYNELFRGISRFHSALGIRERSVRLADLDNMGALGVTFISGKDGKSTGILLNEKFGSSVKCIYDNF